MKVSYHKHFDNNGTCYNQTITIDKAMAVKFNNFVEEIKKNDKEKYKQLHVWSNEEMQRDMYLKRLALGVNYTYLTTLTYFVSFLRVLKRENIIKDIELTRVHYRNTIIIVK